jgi:hypothetical protein
MMGVFSILQYSEWSATVQGKLLKGCLESAVRKVNELFKK